MFKTLLLQGEIDFDITVYFKEKMSDSPLGIFMQTPCRFFLHVPLWRGCSAIKLRLIDGVQQ